MEDALFDRVIENTFTMQELRRRLPLLKDYFEKTLFGSHFAPPTGIEPRDYTWLLLLIEAYEKRADAVLRGVTKETVTKMFRALEERIESITPLIVFLPVVLPGEELDNLGRAIRKTYGKRVFMETRFDPLLIGGAAFAWKGIYKDFSLRERIRENQERILRSFQKYAQYTQR